MSFQSEILVIRIESAIKLAEAIKYHKLLGGREYEKGAINTLLKDLTPFKRGGIYFLHEDEMERAEKALFSLQWELNKYL